MQNWSPPDDITFAVWNSIAAIYQPAASLDAGLHRMGELAEQVRLMWVQREQECGHRHDLQRGRAHSAIGLTFTETHEASWWTAANAAAAL